MISSKKTIIITHPAGTGGDFLGYCIDLNLKNTQTQYRGILYQSVTDKNNFVKKPGAVTFVDSTGHNVHIHKENFYKHESILWLANQDEHIVMAGDIEDKYLYEYFPNSFHIQIVVLNEIQKQFALNRIIVDPWPPLVNIVNLNKLKTYSNKIYISLDYARSLDLFLDNYNKILNFCNIENKFKNTIPQIAAEWIKVNSVYWP